MTPRKKIGKLGGKSKNKLARTETASKAGNKVRIFISYGSEDTHIAETLRTELMSFDLKNVIVFHDASDLRSGTDWERVIEHELADAEWLIAIHTGRRRNIFSFPGWEVGAFTALHSEQGAKQRIFCL